MNKGIEQIFIQKIKDSGISADQVWSSFKKSKDKLVPAIAQDFTTRDILMLAYMDQDAFEKTLETGIMHYHSRSRNKLWMKGESSGNVQRVVEARIDCDLDTMVFLVEQTGPACHTGAKNCFYRSIEELAVEPEEE
jgi:phosphoribosyl-AMP cyclohydrolase